MSFFWVASFQTHLLSCGFLLLVEGTWRGAVATVRGLGRRHGARGERNHFDFLCDVSLGGHMANL